jgi:branched-chain amino acid transport system substrate-binding protein
MPVVEYAFLFPVGIVVATVAMSVGISGSAFWIPIYLLWLSLEPRTAFWLSLLTMLFGFGSGVVRNLRAGTVNGYLVGRYLAVAGPATALAALGSRFVQASWLLRVFAVFVGVYGLRLIWKFVHHGEPPRRHHDNIHYGMAALAGLFHGGIATGGGIVLLPAMLDHKRIRHHSEAIGSTVVLVFILSILAIVCRVDSYLMTCLGGCQSNVLSMLLFAAPGVVVGGQLGPRISRFLPRRFLRLYVGVLLVVVAVLVGIRGLGVTGAQEPGEIRVGLLTEFSKPDSESTSRAVQLAFDGVNNAGGIELGDRRYQLALHIRDTQNRPEEAARAAFQQINQDDVVALIGSTRSLNAIPIANITNSAHVPMISPGSTHPETTLNKPYAFRVIFIDPFQGQVMARFAREDLAAGTAAVLYDIASDYSRGIATVFRQVFEASGGRVVAFETFVTGESDFGDALATIHERQPDVLFLPNFTEEVLAQAVQARQQGIDAVFLGSDGWAASRVQEQPQFDGSFMSCGWHLSAAGMSTEAQAFVNAYREAYDDDPVFSVTALAYDAAGLLIAAIREAGRPEPEAIREALANIEGYPGASGTVTYRGTGGDPPKQAVILEIGNGDARFYKTVEP